MGPACLGEDQNSDLLRQLRLRLKQELRTKSPLFGATFLFNA
jgi:hypothetical protein